MAEMGKGLLATMDWGKLRDLRDKMKSKGDQNIIAPYEHRAYARETVSENPLMAPAMPLLSVGYNLSKVMGVNRGRSDPSIEAVRQATIGAGEGLLEVLQSRK